MTDVYWSLDLSQPISHSFTYDLGGHGWGNQELQCYTDSPRNSYVTASGDTLVISAIAEHGTADGRPQMTSARLVSKQCLAHERGYVEATMGAPQAKGIWYAFWLLPRQPFHWPSDGEIDIAEGWDAKRENGSCIHWGHFNGEDYAKHRVRYHPIESPERMHTYGFCWSPQGLIWFYDGRPTMRAEVPSGIRPFAHFQILFNIAMGGNVMAGSEPVVPSTSEMHVRELKMCHTPPMGWHNFDRAWHDAKDGATM